MKEFMKIVWSKTKTSLKGIILFSVFMDIIFITSTIYSNATNVSVWYLIGLAGFGVVFSCNTGLAGSKLRPTWHAPNVLFVFDLPPL